MYQQQEMEIVIPRMRREERLEQVAHIVGRGGIWTLREIARQAGLKVTPYLRGIVDELYNQGEIEKKKDETVTGLPVWLYRAGGSADD